MRTVHPPYAAVEFVTLKYFTKKPAIFYQQLV